MTFIHNEVVLLFQQFKNSSPLPDDIIYTLRQEWDYVVRSSRRS